MTLDSTLFPRCNPQEAEPGSGLVCGAVRPIVEGVAWDTTDCPIPETPSNGCEQCSDGGSGAGSGESACTGINFSINGKTYTQGTNGCITSSGSFVPDGCYTKICLVDGVPTYGTADAPVIDFGTAQTWCSFGVSYKYENGKITKSGTPIADGVYTRFTIQGGCIVGADVAPLPVYQPSECCDGSSGGGSDFGCSDVAACLGAIPFAGTATSSTRFIGQDGKSYVVATSGGGSSSFDCDDVKTCLADFPANGTASELTQLIGADGKKYFIPVSSGPAGQSGSWCGGLTFSSGLLTGIPSTTAAINVNNSEVSWPPVLGLTSNSFLEVSKTGCKAAITVNQAGLFNAVLDQFANGDAVPDGTRFLAEDGFTYTIEQISEKLGIPALKAQVDAIQAELTAHKAATRDVAHPLPIDPNPTP